MNDLSPQDDETLDILSNRLKILQRKRGHRAATDDILLAWAGLEYSIPQTILDLGTGNGTVALLLLSMLPDAQAVGLEAFEQSYALCVRNIALNDIGARFTVLHQDLRIQTPFKPRQFDLITGAPPFMPVGTGVMPSDPQRAAGRFELRGDVNDYFAKADQNLAPSGCVIILMDGMGENRAIKAARTHGLQVRQVIRICPRPKRAPTYVIVIADRGSHRLKDRVVYMRGSEGDAWSDEYQTMRKQLDLP